MDIPPSSPPTAPRPRPDRRWVRRIVWSLSALAALVALALAAVILILNNLDAGPIKHRVKAAAHANGGIDLDYREGGVSLLSGVVLRDVTIASAPQDAALAPHLVRIGEVRLNWSLGALLEGTIREFAVRDVALTVVIDPSGATSLDRLSAYRSSIVPQAAEPPRSGDPLSKRLDVSLPANPVTVERIALTNLTATIIRPGNATLHAAGLSFAGHVRAGAGHLDALLETVDAPLRIESEQRALELTPIFRIEAKDREASLAFELKVGQHDLVPDLPPGTLASVKAQLAFNPAQGKTTVQLQQLALADGAATAALDVDLPDAGGVILRDASAHASIHQLAERLHALTPPGFTLGGGSIALDLAARAEASAERTFSGLPLTLPAGKDLRLHIALDDVSLPPLRLRSARLEGHAAADGAIVQAEIDGVSTGSAEVERASLSAKVTPLGEGAFAVALSIPVRRIVQPKTLEIRGLALGVEGTAKGTTRFDGLLTLAMDQARLPGATLGPARFELRLKDTAFRADDPLASQATIGLTGTIASVAAAPMQVRDVAVQLESKLANKMLSETSMRVPVEGLTYNGAKLPPVQLMLGLDPMSLDAKEVHAHVKLASGPVTMTAHVARMPGELGLEANASAERLGPFARFVDPALRDMGLSLESRASIRGELIDQKTHLVLRRVDLRRNELTFQASAVDLQASSRGTRRQHRLNLTVDLEKPRLNGKGGAQSMSMETSFDFDRPRLDLRLHATGLLDGDMNMHGDFDVPSRRLSVKADGKLDRLALLGALLPPSIADAHRVDWEKLKAQWHVDAKLPKLVERYVPGSPPRFVFSSDPLAAAHSTSTSELSVSGLDYRGADGTTVDLPRATFALRTRAEGRRVHLETTLDVPRLVALASGTKVEGEKLSYAQVIDLDGDRASGSADGWLSFKVGRLVQDAAPQYRVGDAELKVSARVDTKGSVRIQEARFDNPAGGTHLTATGGIDFRPLEASLAALQGETDVASWIPGRKNLLIEGRLEQNLDSLEGTGHGTVRVPFRLESGNLRYLRASAGLFFDQVDVSAGPLAVRGLNGFIPIVQELELTDTLRPVFGASESPYARLRFTDQQPFLTENPYVSARQITYQYGKQTIALGPLAGNVRVDRNLAAVDQLEMELPRGRVTGQLLAEYRGDDTKVAFRGAITGFKTEGSDERLDANASLTLIPLRRLVDGRIDVVQLGRSHLLAMLDLVDPYHADVASNRMRLAMKFGYPRRVRIGFHEGFANFALELGGSAKVVRIDEIRGAPVGPVLERFMADKVKGKEE